MYYCKFYITWKPLSIYEKMVKSEYFSAEFDEQWTVVEKYNQGKRMRQV